MLRSARIAHLRGDTTAELDILRLAARQFPDEVAPLYALLEANRAHPFAETELARFRGSLVARLEDPERALPVGALEGIRANVEDEDILRQTALHIERRLEADPPETADLLGVLAAIHHDLGDLAAAAAGWARLIEIEPSEEIVWNLYRTYAGLSRWEEASTTFELLLGEHADTLDAELRPVYARLLAKAGRFDELYRQIEVHATGEAANARTLVWLQVLSDTAWDLRDAGDDAKARAFFERALRLDPENEGMRASLVYLYGTEAERAQLAAAEGARWSQEVDAQALFDEGTKQLAAGNAAAAVELLSRAAPELPALEAAWYNLGMAAYRIEDWETTVSAFDRATELNPDRADSLVFRGLALYQLTRCQESVTTLERALVLDDQRSQVHYYLASCYRTLGDLGSAERHTRLYAESSQQ